MENNYEYKVNPDAYRSSYGYGNFEGNRNLYAALSLLGAAATILIMWAYQIR